MSSRGKDGLEIKTAQEAAQDALERDPLREHFVWWDEITHSQIDDFEAFLDTEPGERAIHQYLESHPMLLVQPLSGGHGRYVISRSWLGRDREIDFLVGERSSKGLEWLAVELEDERTPLYKPDGDPSPRLSHALQQVANWRIWLEKNINYAERSRDEEGLGLENIGSRPPGLIIMGRRRLLQPKDGARRRETERTADIAIHTYDWLLHHARGRAESLRRWRGRNA